MPDKWNLLDILSNQSTDQIEALLKKDVDQFESYKKILNSIDEKKMLEILELKERIYESMSKLENYYAMRFYENVKDSEASAKLSYLKQLHTDLSNRIMFFSLWFMKLDDNTAKKFVESKILARFKHYFERIRQLKEHTKSEEIEQIINLKNITSGSFFDVYEIMTSSFEYDFNGKKLTSEAMISKYRDIDPKIRKQAYDILLGKYREHKAELYEIYKNIVLDWTNEDLKIRNYNKSISSRNMSNDLDDSTVDAVLDVVRENSKLWHRYFQLKYKILSKKRKFPYSRCHIYAPYEVKLKSYDYDYCKKYVLETFKQFDQRFFDAANEIFKAKHVHSHPQKNKRGGAFCNIITNKHAPYVLLNHTDTIRDMFTIAHELGHGMHDMFSRVQSNLLQQPPLPIAETASVFGEMILADRILKESKNNEEKKFILMNLLDNEFATIPRQAFFVIFEKIAHENIPKGITKEELDKKYLEILKEQFGSMEIPEVFKNEWNYIPHIHETPFYCYAYAFGNLLVLSLYDMYRKQGKVFIEKYIKFLSYGGSRYPKELLAGLGIDINDKRFWQKGIQIIKEQIEQLEELSK